MHNFDRPLLALTLGDPSGIGPEVVVPVRPLLIALRKNSSLTLARKSGWPIAGA